MGSFMTKLFIDVTSLPHDGYGFVQLLMLGAAYGFILMHGSNMIKDGSELLLLVPWLAGVVGTVVLPVLGAVPDGAIIIFSGLGDDAQQQVAVGIGALAGSTVMLLTVPWVMCLVGGRVNILPDGTYNYIRNKHVADWKKLDPPNKIAGTGVKCSPLIAYNAKVMVATLISYLIVQIPAIVKNCSTVTDEPNCQSPPVAALVGGIVASLLFCFYLWDQARIAGEDEAKEGKLDIIRAEALRNGYMSIRGMFPADSFRAGDMEINADDKRFQAFLRPYFKKYDTDNSGSLSLEELDFLLKDLGERPSQQELKNLFDSIDTDKSGAISFQEFTVMMVSALEKPDLLKATPSTVVVAEGALRSEDDATNAAKEDNDEEEEEEEPEMPDDLAELSPKEQQRRLLIRSCATMGIGVLLVLFFSDPMVDILSELGNRLSIKPFYVAFVLAPLASNASELIAAYAYSQKKTEKSMTISFSSLVGAACMNNTFCLALFLFLVAGKQLKWEFTAETASIVVAEILMFFIALRREHPMWTGFLVAALFPLAIGVVAVLEGVGLD